MPEWRSLASTRCPSLKIEIPGTAFTFSKVEATGHVNHLHEDWDDAPRHAGNVLLRLALCLSFFLLSPSRLLSVVHCAGCCFRVGLVWLASGRDVGMPSVKALRVRFQSLLSRDIEPVERGQVYVNNSGTTTPVMDFGPAIPFERTRARLSSLARLGSFSVSRRCRRRPRKVWTLTHTSGGPAAWTRRACCHIALIICFLCLGLC